MTQTEIQLTLNNLVAKLRSCNKKVRWSIGYTKQGDPTVREFDASYEDGPLAAASVEEKMNLLLKDNQIDYIRVDMGNSRVRSKDYVEFSIRDGQQLGGVAPYRNDMEIYPSDTRDIRNAKAAFSQMHGAAPFGNVNAMLGLLGFDIGLNGADDNSPIGGLGAILAVRDGNIRQQYEMKEQTRLLDVAHKDAEQLRGEIASLKSEIADKDKTIDKLRRKLERSEELVDELEKMKPENSLGGVALKALGQSILTGVVKSNTGLISALSGIPKPALDAAMASQGADDGQPQDGQSDDDDTEVEVEGESPRATQLGQIEAWCQSLTDDEFNQFLAIMNVFMLNKASMTSLYNQWRAATAQARHDQAQPQTKPASDGLKLT